MTRVGYTDPEFYVPGQPNEHTQWFNVEEGVPGPYAARGATTVAQYQQMAAQDLSDKSIQAQREIAQQSQAFNESQAAEQKAQFQQQQNQAQEQADRQSTYDTGRSQALQAGQGQIDQAFARFTPEYFDQYTRDYMGKVDDQINYQKQQAQKDLAFQMARQGLTGSQARVNQQGLIEETAGRTRDEQVALAQADTDALRQRTAAARQNLLNQVVQAQSIGSPIAGSTIQDVNSNLNTQRQAISGVASTAGDVTASLGAVPVVNTLSNIFGSIAGAGGAALQGINAGDVRVAINRGLAGTNPT